jgi:spore coat protein U-like protein
MRLINLNKIQVKALALSLLCVSVLGAYSTESNAGTSTANPKATATLAASCQISAQNINFGQINPQTASAGVSASSNMNVFCTKGSAYTIGLAYGGIYGTGTGTTNYYVLTSQNFQVNNGQNLYKYNFTEYNAAGQVIGSYSTGYTTAAPSISGYNNPGGGTKYVSNSVVYSYGKMVGVVSGDTIQYKITVPGQSSEVWNTGNYTYANTGTGATQTFPMNAVATTTAYPTPDTYTDTVTATINF